MWNLMKQVAACKRAVVMLIENPVTSSPHSSGVSRISIYFTLNRKFAVWSLSMLPRPDAMT